MEKKYGIGLTAAAVGLLALLTVAYGMEYRYDRQRELRRLEVQAQEQEEQEARLSEEREEQKDAVSAQGEAVREELYCLAELNGYVVVYLSDRSTVFEYTNILVDNLPEELQEEVRSGKLLEGSEKLYGFLENYSS